MMRLKLAILLGAFFWATLAVAQPSSDEKARELVSLGKKMFVNGNWKDAANSFELATQRPENELSSFALYMTGLSYLNMGSPEKAEEHFTRLLRAYPGTRYGEDVKYNRALLLLESKHNNDRDRGLDQLLSLSHAGTQAGIKQSAEQSLRFYLFNRLDANYLSIYSKFVSAADRPLFTEAICHHHNSKGDGSKVLAEIKAFNDQGGVNTPYLNALKTKYESGRTISRRRLNIAVFASTHGDRADTATIMPTKGISALEMLEGMMLALDERGPEMDKQINLKVFDTRGDTAYTRMQLDSLAAFGPDVIFSDIKTYICKILSDWAEKRKVLLLVPRNTLNELIAGKSYTFLLHPSVNTMGAKMAEYLVKKEGKRSIAIFNDKSYYSERFSKAFLKSGQEAGATVSEKTISKEPGKVRSEASIEAQNIKNAQTEAVYVPISNEESAGMILSYLNYHRAKPTVAGGPDWEMFNVIDSELKTGFDLKYTTLYWEGNDSLSGAKLVEKCMDRFAYEPTQNTVIGYDIMSWLLQAFKQSPNQTDPLKVVQEAAVFRGIHQDFFFGNAQDNQAVNIVRYAKGKLEKVNGN